MDEIPSRWRGECQAGTQFNSSMCNKKLIGARYFNKGYIRSHPKANIMNSTRDIVGHGTHTSSIAAGNFVKGALYFGSDTNSYMKSPTTPWYKHPIAIASFTLNKKGIFVSMAVGNGGSDSPTIINDMPWVLTVAAGAMDRQFSCLITLGNGVFVPGSSLYHDSFTSSQIPMFFMCQCNNISHGAGNKICVSSSENEPLGCIRESARWKNSERLHREEGDQATGKISFHLTRLGTVPAPLVSEFSSRGPPRGLPVILKPDLMAPGHQILASWPYLVRQDGSLGEFNIDSGTSMACPHASGLAAILKAVHPDWSPAAIRSAMMTTSSITDNSNNPINEITWDVIKEATPLAMGTGQNKALNPGLIYGMDVGDYVNLLCGLNFTLTQIEVITRSSTYNCNNLTLDVNYPSFIASFSENEILHTRGKVLKVFQRTITSVENKMSVYKATLTGLKGFNVTVEPPTLIFTKKNDKKSYKLVIEGPILKDNEVVHGFLSWVSTKRKNVVRSPILALGRMSRP
nr:subtilisin-like protease SBT1.9 [Tanacetum cinerariifolium]